MNTENELRNHLDKLHTTELGAVRIKRNLSLDTDHVVEWCKDKINSNMRSLQEIKGRAEAKGFALYFTEWVDDTEAAGKLIQ